MVRKTALDFCWRIWIPGSTSLSLSKLVPVHSECSQWPPLHWPVTHWYNEGVFGAKGWDTKRRTSIALWASRPGHFSTYHKNCRCSMTFTHNKSICSVCTKEMQLNRCLLGSFSDCIGQGIWKGRGATDAEDDRFHGPGPKKKSCCILLLYI